MQRGFLPFPVKGKTPPVQGATGRNGSVTAESIAQWSADPEWAHQNVGLRANLYVGIDVDHYGPKNGADQLRELEAKLGPLPATPSSTARGADSPARQQFFALREPVEMYGKPPIPGVEPKNVHIDIIQAHHRYTVAWPSIHPETGAPYLWYDAEGELLAEPPHVDDFEYLPEAWIEYLRLDEREYGHQGAQWSGEIPASATRHEERKIRTIIARLQSLPDVWAPGSGWHDTVFHQACWLSRIARSNAYALTPEQAHGILLQYTPTYPSWGPENIDEQWHSAQKVTAGQFESPPEPDLPALQAWRGFPSDRPYPTIQGRPFVAAWAHAPEPSQRAAHRAGLLHALLEAGVEEIEAATLVWHCAASLQPITFGGQTYSDPHSKCITIEQLWAEVAAAIETLTTGTIADDAPAPIIALPAPPPQAAGPSVTLINEQERAQAATVDWFGARYLDWARKTFEAVNEPYYRMNRWTVLSVIFSPKGVLPRPGANDRPVNLFQAIVGRTTTGKSEALRPPRHIFKAYYMLSESPSIGGDHTGESLKGTLIERDGKATWFHLDEAHTKIPTWRKPNSPYSEVPGVLTLAFDGEIDAIFRRTDKEISGRAAQAYLTVHLMGTPQGMADVMSPADWESGFLNRFVWGIGDMPTESVTMMAGGFLTEEDLAAEGDDDTAAVASGKAMYQQWAAEFAAAVQSVSTPSGAPARMRIPADVARRHQNIAVTLQEIAKNSPYEERLRPTFRRLTETVLRCAALVALSSGRTRIEMGDLLVAAEQTEEWAANILIMVAATDESLRTREVNMIEKALLERGGVVSFADIHRLPRFANRRRDVEDMIGELVAQGRASIDQNTGTKILRAGGYARAA
nr:bifunctional DNA primase/polymerase [Microbacterium marinum]